jgi:uncharacterized membrane protein YcaP (DUF421 family)
MSWEQLVGVRHSLPELILRAVTIYLGILVLLRLVGQRETGTIGRADLLMMVLIADAAQNALAPEQLSLTEGFILVATIISSNFALDWLGQHVAPIGRFLHPGPLPLVRNGRILWRNMRKGTITEAELMTHLRQHGVDDPVRVRRAYLEGNGLISVILQEPATGGAREQDNGPPPKQSLP